MAIDKFKRRKSRKRNSIGNINLIRKQNIVLDILLLLFRYCFKHKKMGWTGNWYYWGFGYPGGLFDYLVNNPNEEFGGSYGKYCYWKW